MRLCCSLKTMVTSGAEYWGSAVKPLMDISGPGSHAYPWARSCGLGVVRGVSPSAGGGGHVVVRIQKGSVHW